MESSYLFLIFFLFIAGTFAWKYFRTGSLTGAMLGGKINREIGQIDLARTTTSSEVLRVFSMESSSGEKFVGISVVSKAALGASMVPFRMSATQAQELARLLESASRE